MEQKKYTVGLLAGSLKGAGAEKTILTLADFLSRKNCTVTLFLLNEDLDYVAPDYITVIRLDGSHRKDKEKQLGQLTQTTSYDLFVTSRPDYYPFIHSQHKFISVHISPYSWIQNEKKSSLSKWLKLSRIKRKYRYRKLIALSEGIRKELVNHLGCKATDITVINNPFDVTTIHSEASKEGPLPDGDYIIYVASFIPRKRHRDLLQAFHQLNTDLKLVLVGKGPGEQDLQSFAKKLGVSDRVIFWGWDKNPYRLIKHARLSMLTSEAEGLPRTLIESLLLGIPVVSTNCPSGPDEIMIGAFRPFLVPIGDIEQLTAAMQSALAAYPDISQLKLDRFAGEQVADRYLALIEQTDF